MNQELIIVLAGLGTLGIFTFLIRENPIFRFFEHLFIGVAAGLLPILTIKNLLWPNVLAPLFGFETALFPDGTIAVPYEPWNLLFLIPIIIGLFYYAAFFPKIAWLAQVVIGISLGYTAGLSIKGFFAEIIPQITTSFKPLIVLSETQGFLWQESVNNILFVGILLIVMYYFLSTFRGESRGSLGTRKIGRLLLMVCFGAFFGSTVMARMALLVERIEFLTGDWISTIRGFFG